LKVGCGRFFFFCKCTKKPHQKQILHAPLPWLLIFYIPKTKTKKQRLSQSVFESVVAVIFKVFLT
jgi:hypothetical protein